MMRRQDTEKDLASAADAAEGDAHDDTAAPHATTFEVGKPPLSFARVVQAAEVAHEQEVDRFPQLAEPATYPAHAAPHPPAAVVAQPKVEAEVRVPAAVVVEVEKGPGWHGSFAEVVGKSAHEVEEAERKVEEERKAREEEERRRKEKEQAERLARARKEEEQREREREQQATAEQEKEKQRQAEAKAAQRQRVEQAEAAHAMRHREVAEAERTAPRHDAEEHEAQRRSSNQRKAPSRDVQHPPSSPTPARSALPSLPRRPRTARRRRP